MADIAGTARRVIIVTYLLVLHGVLVWLLLDKYVFRTMFVDERSAVPAPESSPGPVATPVHTPFASPTVRPEPTSSIPPADASPPYVIIPVQGITPEELIDSFSQERPGGRVHEAIDIPAPRNTPVIAAADGEIVKFHDSEAGGITIYQISADRRFFFYYAHLQSRAPGISEKQFVKKGTMIGYVGDSGNAGAGNFHLHFSINSVVDPARFWEGVPINPYSVLKGQTELR